jgi:hemerythrin-like metal-binding protein
MTEKKGIDAVNSTLKELESYAAEHFQTEEILMKQNGYPDYPSHKQEHDEFIEKIEDLKKKFEKQKETYTVPIETWIFLKNWLNQHIMGTDKQYVPFFQEKGIQ